jgi:FixJ family two-component response regulator
VVAAVVAAEEGLEVVADLEVAAGAVEVHRHKFEVYMSKYFFV